MCGKIQALQWVVLNQTVMTSMIWQEMLLSSVVTGMKKLTDKKPKRTN